MTNAKACYSNLQNYGLSSEFRPIQPPVLSSVMLALFEIDKPHDIPQPKLVDDNRAYKCNQNTSSCVNNNKMNYYSY